MAAFEKMYVELYTAVNEALRHLVQGNQTEAVICLLEGQVNTVKQLIPDTDL